jgi:hypothetical protein
VRGPLAGVTLPSGFYFNNDAYYYYGEREGGLRTQIGGAVVANIKQRAHVDFVTPVWVTPLQLLGGNLAFSVTVPFGAPYLSAGTPVSTCLKVLREVKTENRFRGTIGLFTVSFPLGGQAAPEVAGPVTAKY